MTLENSEKVEAVVSALQGETKPSLPMTADPVSNVVISSEESPSLSDGACLYYADNTTALLTPILLLG